MLATSEGEVGKMVAVIATLTTSPDWKGFQGKKGGKS